MHFSEHLNSIRKAVWSETIAETRIAPTDHGAIPQTQAPDGNTATFQHVLVIIRMNTNLFVRVLILVGAPNPHPLGSDASCHFQPRANEGGFDRTVCCVDHGLDKLNSEYQNRIPGVT